MPIQLAAAIIAVASTASCSLGNIIPSNTAEGPSPGNSLPGSMNENPATTLWVSGQYFPNPASIGSTISILADTNISSMPVATLSISPYLFNAPTEVWDNSKIFVATTSIVNSQASFTTILRNSYSSASSSLSVEPNRKYWLIVDITRTHGIYLQLFLAQ